MLPLYKRFTVIRYRHLKRLVGIHRVLARYRLEHLIPDRLVGYTLLGKIFCNNAAYDAHQHTAMAVRIRLALEELGPIFVKFGQALSTRRDLLPDDLAEELVKLQDRVPPFPGVEASHIVEEALGRPLDELFAEFDSQPLASASVAQVHPARLLEGQSVVVKILRPGIESQIRDDLALLYILAHLTQRFWTDTKRLRLVEVVAEFEKTLLDELDLVREAANAAEMRRRFEGSNLLYIPKVYFSHTRRNVLVMERISGIPVGDVARIREQGIDLRVLAERGVEIFFTQVLRDSFFHADMHPGNIFVTPEAQYIAVDFGIVGSLSHEDKRYIAENFRAFFNRDYRRVAEMHLESGWVPKHTRIVEFEAAIRAVCEPIFEKPLKDISYGHLLVRLFQVARRFDMEVQPQLVLLQKTLLNIEGLGRELYPDLDLWQTARPFLERWFIEELGPSAALKTLRARYSEWLQHGPEVPDLLYHALKSLASHQQSSTLESQERAQWRGTLIRQQHCMLAAITGSACLVSGTLFAVTGLSFVLAAFFLIISAVFFVRALSISSII